MSAKVGLFACCRAPVRSGQHWVAPIGQKPAGLDVGEATGEIVPLRRSYGAARHEAAHAATQIALGGIVLKTSIDGQPHMTAAPGLCRRSRAVMTLAGPAADAWAKSLIACITDAELAFWIAAIRDLKGGGCDRCAAVRAAILLCGRDEGGVLRSPSDEAVISEFRHIETLASAIVRVPPVWLAIEEIASQLSDVGTLDGAAVLEICRWHFEPGFLTMEA